MKSLKMLISALTACLLVGASSAAMAQMVTICPDGVIDGTEQAPLMVSEIALNGVSCVIKNVSVTGDATITNGQNVSFIVLSQILHRVEKVLMDCWHYAARA